jgi:hypothetical protein
VNNERIEESNEGGTGGASNNIQAALASIMMQETNTGNSNRANNSNTAANHNRQSTNFELSAD